MKTKVLFLGFADLKVDLNQYEDHRIWTMNDYYKWFPGLIPDVVFEIHREGAIEESRLLGRFPGDYKKIFNESGANIVTRFSHELDKESNVSLDMLAGIFGEKFFVGTFSFMFAWAIQFRYAHITIEGIHLKQHSEYHTQIPGMLRNIDETRKRGIVVNVPGGWEDTWRALAPNIKEDWKEIYG